MGSLCPPQPSRPSRGTPHPSSRIYLSFCSRELLPNKSISNWIACFDTSNNAWHHITEIPGLAQNHVLKGFSMVAVRDWIYVIGGRLCTKVPYPNSDNTSEIDLEVLPNVLRYNITNDMWFKCSSLKTPRFDFACTVNAGKIYVAGGKSRLGSAEGTPSAEVYDPLRDEWKPLPNMNTPRYKCVGVTWQGKVHVIGGFATNTMERSSAEVYDEDRSKWDLIVGMWKLDVPPYQIFAVDDRLFSSGDCLKAWKGHIEVYDGNLMWNEVDGSHLESITITMPDSTLDPSSDAASSRIERLYLTMAPVGTQLYFLAGHRATSGNSRMISSVHVFDTSENGAGWRSFGPVEEEGERELCSHCCVVSSQNLTAE